MSERKRARVSSPSSPLATVDDIQRRLRRPSSAFSSSPPEDRRAQIGIHLSESKPRAMNRKLEDYLDPDLLAQVASQMFRRKTAPVKREVVGGFDWPVNELKVLVVEPVKGAVSLDDDVDLKDEFGDGDVEACTAFVRFERSVWQRFERSVWQRFGR